MYLHFKENSYNIIKGEIKLNPIEIHGSVITVIPGELDYSEVCIGDEVVGYIRFENKFQEKIEEYIREMVIAAHDELDYQKQLTNERRSIL